MSNTPSITSDTSWVGAAADNQLWANVAQILFPPYINTCRWFAGKARQQAGFSVKTIHVVPLPDQGVTYLLIVDVRYVDGEPETYLLPVSWISQSGNQKEADLLSEIPEKGHIGNVALEGQAGLLIDAIYDEQFRQALFSGIYTNQNLPQTDGQLAFQRGKGLEDDTNLPSRVLPVDSSNSAMTFGNKYFLKLYRKLFQETNPEVDMVSFLTDESGFTHIPAFGGSLSWQRNNAPDVTLGMIQRMVPNEKDSWMQTGDYLNDFLYGVPNRLFSIREDVFDKVELLGRRTGELHSALYKPDASANFAPESFTDAYRQFLIKRFEDLLDRRYALLIDNYAKLDPHAQRLAWVFMEAREMIETFIADFRTRPLDSLRIRIHGDYHLGQVLATETDFVMIDFEGEPESTIAERKIKHSPLKDVAGMIRSYHYAVSAKLFNATETETIDPEHLQRVSDRWFYLIRDTFLDAYLNVFGAPHPLFKNNNEINFLLLVYLLEKAVYELGYEISYRPAWVKIPLKGIIDVIREIEKIRLSDGNIEPDIPMLQTVILQNQRS